MRRVKQNRTGSKNTGRQQRRKLQLVLIVCAIAIFGLGWWWITQRGAGNFLKTAGQQPNASTPADAQKIREYKQLIGRWVRPDGGYVIEVRDVKANGDMDAGYFNPRPINVSRAYAAQSGQGTVIMIELKDVGYPGATYNLTYNPQKDLLVGLYYQPTAQRSFEVVFVRSP